MKNEIEYRNSEELTYEEIYAYIGIKQGEVYQLPPPKDVTSFLLEDEEIYFYGFCDKSIQSSSLLKKCPFDEREYFYQFRENHKQVIIYNNRFVSKDRMFCRNICKIQRFKDQKNIEKMSQVPEEHREELRKLIKYTLLDYVKKI